MHRILLEQPIPEAGQIVVIDGDEAIHAARVKRMEVGEAVHLLDGAGMVVGARVEAIHRAARHKGGVGPTIEVRVIQRNEVAPERPVLEVFTATPKGGRVDEMIDQLSQAGAAAWGPLATERGIVDPREHKLARLERIAREAAKQCERAWLMRIERGRSLEVVLADTDAVVIVADVSGEPYRADPSRAGQAIRLLIGPEGGWTPEELRTARERGARIARFGPHVMRIETAAVVAAGMVMSAGGGVVE